MYEALGRRIRAQRKQMKMTQEELAEKAEISNSFLGHIERGTRKASLDTLVKICNALKASPNLLLQDSLDDDLMGADMSYSPSQKRLLREIGEKIFDYQRLINEKMPEEITIIRPDQYT